MAQLVSDVGTKRIVAHIASDREHFREGLFLQPQRRPSAARAGGRSPPERVRCMGWFGVMLYAECQEGCPELALRREVSP